MKAVVIGAGRIGCGLAADLLHRSGHDVVMVGRGSAFESLTRSGACTVRLTDGLDVTDRTVEFADVVHVTDIERVTAHVAGSGIVISAVGANQLDSVGDLIADGLGQARRPLDVLAFENRLDAASALRTTLTTRLGERALRHGYSGSVISRAVAQRVLPTDGEPLLVVGDHPAEVFVDAGSLIGNFTAVEGFIGVDDFRAYYRRKLHRFSAGHATAAYLGALKGYRYLHAAVGDPEIATTVLNAMDEGRQGLEGRYGADVAGTPSEVVAILDRFSNAALGDTVERVGRDAARKLARTERLIGAARLAARAGVAPMHLSLAAAAALDRSPTLQLSGRRLGDAQAVVARATGLKPRHTVVALIAEAWVRLAEGGRGDNLLLSLTDLLWAFAPRTRLPAPEGSHS